MASQLPQRFVPQQPSSSQTTTPNASDGTTSRQRRRSSVTQSTTSEDSQTVFLNHPSSSESSPKPEASQSQNAPRPEAHSIPSATEPRKCWICFGDETEDSPTSSRWRSPCPCALTAHEACLLDWVADLEAPGRGKPSKVECPQCKAKITIARPRSPVISLLRATDKATARLLIPSAVLTLAGTAFAGCWMHGLSTVFLIFGPDDAERLLGIDSASTVGSPWGLTLGLIPAALVVSRTTYADNFLPVIPIFYFVTNAARREGPLWPPSVAFTIATLPYILAVYNEIYSRLCVPYEKAWIKSVQPRAGEDDNNEGREQEQNQEGANNELPGGLNFELDFQVELVEEEEDGAEEQQPQPAQRAADAPAGDQAPAAEGQPQNPAPDNLAEHLQNHQPQQPAANQPGVPAGQFVIGGIATAQMVIGALVFPTVSSAMGVLLKAALPRTWTTPPGRWDRYPRGFLQSRFGRSIAGGFLFIAIKDTLFLYAKYRLAQDHKKRRVVDYEAKKSKEAPTSGS